MGSEKTHNRIWAEFDLWAKFIIVMLIPEALQQ